MGVRYTVPLQQPNYVPLQQQATTPLQWAGSAAAKPMGASQLGQHQVFIGCQPWQV
jgi:hypothetical protein